MDVVEIISQPNGIMFHDYKWYVVSVWFDDQLNHQAPLLTCFTIIPSWISYHMPKMYGMKFLIHSATSKAAPLKFGNG